MTTLVICEKLRDGAEKIAAAFDLKQGKGHYAGKILGRAVKVVWAKGHLLSLRDPDEIIPDLKWTDSPERLIPIPRDFRQRVSADSPKMPAHAQPRAYLDNIKGHLAGCSEVILATDADREGEAIGWNILASLAYNGPVMRAWLAAGLDTKSLHDAFSNLRPPSATKSWWRAAQARDRSDWAFMMLVRTYSYYAAYGVYGDQLGVGFGSASVMSVGRVQTPALAMIVRREEEIERFVSTDHFRVSGSFGFSGTVVQAQYDPTITTSIIDSAPPGVVWDPSREIIEDGKAIPLDRPLFVDKIAVDRFRERLLACPAGVSVSAYSEGSKKKSPPKTYSMSDAQADIAKALKLDAGVVQSILEDLRDQGYTSYPRTPKAELPMNFYEPDNRNGMLDAIRHLPALAAAVSEARQIHNGVHPSVEPFVPAVYVKGDLSHYGIVPTTQVMTPEAFASLTPQKKDKGKILYTREHMQIAYEMIARRFVVALLPPAVLATQKAELIVPVEDLLGNPTSRFSMTGSRVVSPGWMQFMKSTDDEDKEVLQPALSKGMPGTVEAIDLSATATKPPPRYNAVTFPLEMESVGKTVRDPELRKRLKDSNGIGTPATRKSIVDILLVREYIRVEKNLYFPTPKGRALIKAVPGWLASPETTAIWDGYLVRLCELTDDAKAASVRDEFVERQIARLEKLIGEVIAEFHGTLGARKRSGGDQPTPRMIARIKDLATRSGLTINAGVLTSFASASAFLDSHKELFAAPSDAQVALARSISQSLPEGVVFDAACLSDRTACAAFISANMQYATPTEAQLAFANKLHAELNGGSDFPAEAVRSRAACSAYINKLRGGEAPAKSGPANGGKRAKGSVQGARKPSPAKRKRKAS